MCADVVVLLTIDYMRYAYLKSPSRSATAITYSSIAVSLKDTHRDSYGIQDQTNTRSPTLYLSKGEVKGRATRD